VVIIDRSELRDYYYPNTHVGFVQGELDVFADIGRIFFDAITSETSWVVLPSVGHGVPYNPGGASTILEMLLESLGLGWGD